MPKDSPDWDFHLNGITCRQVQYFKTIAESITALIFPLSSKVQIERKGLANCKGGTLQHYSVSVSFLFARKGKEASPSHAMWWKDRIIKTSVWTGGVQGGGTRWSPGKLHHLLYTPYTPFLHNECHRQPQPSVEFWQWTAVQIEHLILLYLLCSNDKAVHVNFSDVLVTSVLKSTWSLG